MPELQRLVAVISPWDKLPELVKKKFRVESLPEEKKVMVWRDDLQTREDLEAELKGIGIGAPEIRTKKVTARWQDVD
jgi:hypothetical protein